MKNEEKQRKTSNFILGFIIHVFYGIYFLLYIIFTPFRIVFKSKKKQNKINADELNGNVENNQEKIDEIFDKKKKNSESKRLKEEKRQMILAKKQEQQAKKDEIKRKKQEKKEAILTEKRKKQEELNRIKEEKRQEERAKKEAILAEKRKRQEEIRAQKQAKRQEILEKKRLEQEKKNLAKKEKLEAERLKKKERRDALLAKKQEEKNKRDELKRIKEEKQREKNAAKEQAKLDKKEAALAKKRKSEAYVNEKFKGETGKKGIKGFFKDLNSLPDRISKSISKRFKNSLLYRNAQNNKDRNRQVLLINFDGDDAIKSEQKQVYQYVGKNADGKVVTDYFPAYSRVEVHSFLLSEGFEVYSIKTSKLINILHKSSASINTKFKNKDLIFFLTQLSTYIKAGIPLVESLKILSRQFKKKAYQKIFRAMIYNLTMGDSFSIAMEKQGRAFPNLLINMIKASEMTGELPEALDDMADYYTEADATRKQMITALTYPTIVFVFALGVITFIMLYVVPKFVDIYNSMDSSTIPAFTLFVMNLSYFLQDNVIWIFGALVAIIVLFVVAYRNIKAFRWAMQWLFMHIPVIKNIIIYNEVTMFTKTFASLLSHNVFITDTLEILSKITNNEIYKMLVKDTAANLERGEKISTAYKDQWAFPIPAYEMIVTGERTGQLSEMMSKVSTYYQDLHKNTVTRLKAFIEPILIVGLTVVVGFIVLAIVIPMFNLYNQVI